MPDLENFKRMEQFESIRKEIAKTKDEMLFKKYATVVLEKDRSIKDINIQDYMGRPTYLAEVDTQKYDSYLIKEEIPVIEDIVKAIKEGIKKEGFVRDTEYCIEAYIITNKSIEASIEYILSKGRRNTILREFKEGDTIVHFKRETLTEDDIKKDPMKYIYMYVGKALQTESIDGEEQYMAIYKTIGPENRMFARPFDMFMSKVDSKKYPNIRHAYRLTKLSEW